MIKSLIWFGLLMHSFLAMDIDQELQRSFKKLKVTPPRPSELSKLPNEALTRIASFGKQPLSDLISLYRAINPRMDPLDMDADNPLSYHDASVDNQSALSDWLRMPLNSLKKRFQLKKLLENPTVDFNIQRKLKAMIEAESVPSIGYWPNDRFDPKKIAKLDLAITQVFLLGDLYSFNLLLDKGVIPDWGTQVVVIKAGNLELTKRIFEIREGVSNTIEDVPRYYLLYAINSGNLDLVKYLVEERGIQEINEEVISETIEKGTLAIMEYFMEEKRYIVDRWMDLDRLRLILGKAARKGNLEMFQYLQSLQGNVFGNNEIKRSLLRDVSGSGNLPMLMYLMINFKNVQPDMECLYAAIDKGGLFVLKYLVQIVGLVPNDECLLRASKNGALLVVRYLLRPKSSASHQLLPSLNCLQEAAHIGNIWLVKLFVENYGLIPNSETLHNTLEVFNIDLIKYLIKITGLNPSNQFLNKAAEQRKFNFIKYLTSIGVRVSSTTIESACLGGNIEIVKYLINKSGITPNQECLKQAAMSGNIKLVKFLVEDYRIIPEGDTLNFIKDHGKWRDHDYTEILSYLKSLMNLMEIS